MKTAKLTTTIRTFFEDGTYRNNSVELTLPEPIARLIFSAWQMNEVAPVHESARALYLAKNQTADVKLEIEGQRAVGIRGMSSEEGVGDVFTYEGMEDNL